MRRPAAILVFSILAVVALLLGLRGDRGERPPPATPDPASSDAAAGALPALADPHRAENAAAPAAPAPAWHPKPPPAAELVLIDGFTGEQVSVQPVRSWRRIDPAAVRSSAPFVAGVPSWDFTGPLSIFAEEVRLTAAVWPELDLTVRVVRADGSPALGAAVDTVLLGGRARPFDAPRAGAGGETRVRGVPWMSGERVLVFASDPDVPHAQGRSSAAVGDLPSDPVRLKIVLPEPDDMLIIRDARVSDHNETDNDMPFEESLGKRRPPATVRVRVLRADGTPAFRARVRAYPPRREGGYSTWWLTEKRTDAEGRVRLTLPPEMEVGLAVREPGFLFGKPVAATPAADPPEVVLKEDPGADLTVRVVDGEGRPLPGVEISVDHPRWVWLENGVQRFGLYSGPDGRIRLPRLPLEEVTVRARYGGRRARAAARPPGTLVLKLP